MTSVSTRWLFADQLGPHFTDSADQPVLLVESRAAFRRRRVHRRKAHLVLSALRHRAAEQGSATLVRAEGYQAALEQFADHGGGRLTVCAPTSHAARRFVTGLESRGQVEVLPARGYAVTETQFAHWAGRRGGRRLLLEDFYREVRRHHDLLLEASPDGPPAPVGGRWNYDEENREPPPRRVAVLADAVAVAQPWWPVEDDVDAQVREDLDRWSRDDGIAFLGDDGPRRFAVTRAEALAALEQFVTQRLDAFGPYEDAMLAGDRWMAHSLLSAPLNLGLLHPLEVARRAVQAYEDGTARLASVEGFVRQVVGWRDYVWHLYWHSWGESARHDPVSGSGSVSVSEQPFAANALGADRPLPPWFADLDPRGEVTARCLSRTLADVREQGWTHHIPRLMVLGNWALQRGYDPQALSDWFARSFVDGYDWVMTANVVGMSQYADGGLTATKPYASGGAYIKRMSDFCGGCAYDPTVRVGPTACPFTAGYWAFLHRTRDQLAGNHRMARPLAALRRLADLDAVVAQERDRGDSPP